MTSRSSNSARLFHGWTFEYDLEDERFGIFAAPNAAGYVTVDYKMRGFRIGISRHGRLETDREYTGHGWRKRLEIDAMTYLNGLLAK